LLGTPFTFPGQFPNPLGTSYLHSRIRSAAGTPFGVFMVAEEFRRVSASVPIAHAAAFNVHNEGERPNPDIITVPEDQLEP
jgi:hypothetical protein